MARERFLPGTLVGDRFEIERLAGAGGMGDVYRALDRRTGAAVALKFLRQVGKGYVTRFEREARALAQLTHPGIVRYVAHGREPAFFLAMEWLEGEDLARRLARGPLSVGQTLIVARGIADALSAAHARGIVHRDIKPSNVFLCGGRLEEVKLLDFGVAQLDKSTLALTGTGQLIGTLGYMAPEQAMSGRDMTPAADVFSLGCVLFECVAGRGPFAGEWVEVLSKILLSEPPRLRELRRDAPHALDELLARMLRKDPSSRPSLAAVSADVASLLTAGSTTDLEVAESTRDVPAVTGDERRLLAVIAVSDTAVDTLAGAPSTASADTMPNSSIPLQHVVARHEGHLDVLEDKTVVVSLTSAGAATDLASRAARCALAIREALPQARLSVASGRGDSSEPRAAAEVVARAQKLLSLGNLVATTAAGGTRRRDPSGEPRRHIRIDDVTAGLLDPSFDVSGDAAALTLVGQRDMHSVRKLLGKPTPCVGRERELAMLDGIVAECLDEPLATALLVTANAGVGKSRLRYEILRGLRERPEPPEIWVARGDPITAGSAFGMLAQLLRGMAGLVEGELVEVRRLKLLARIGRHLAVDDAKRVAQFLGDVVRAEFPGDDRPLLRAARQDPALMNDQLRSAFDELVAAETAAGPLVIVLEDLQWGDLPSVQILDRVLASQRHRPLLVLAFARPEVHELFPHLFRDRRLNELRLSDLTPSASRRLAHEVLGPDAAPSLVDALVEKAHGNAFFLEELIRSVAEGTAALPETVVAMVQARLERLEPGARRLFRAASVFGARFWVGGLSALVGADAIADVETTLQDLVEREVLVRHSSSRFADDPEYGFRHILVRDAAYAMLTERDRRASHLLAAEWLEARGERDALVLAEHLERSGERQRAVVWYLWAAEQALEGNDLASVIDRAQRGIDCGAQGVVLGELYLLRAEASGWAGHERHLELAENALGLLRPGTAAWARAAAELAVACRARGDHERLAITADTMASTAADGVSIGHAWGLARTAVELLGAGEAERAAALIALLRAQAQSADEHDAPTLRAMIDWLEAATALYAGTPGPLLERARAIADTFEATGYVRHSALVALHAAIAAVAVGDAAEGIAWAERAADLARRLGLRSHELRARAWLALHLGRTGLDELALATAEAALRDAGGDRVVEADARVHLATLRASTGDLEAAAREAASVWEDERFPLDARGRAGALLARLHLARDRVVEALATSDRALEALARACPLGDAEARETKRQALARSHAP